MESPPEVKEEPSPVGACDNDGDSGAGAESILQPTEKGKNADSGPNPSQTEPQPAQKTVEFSLGQTEEGEREDPNPNKALAAKNDPEIPVARIKAEAPLSLKTHILLSSPEKNLMNQDRMERVFEGMVIVLGYLHCLLRVNAFAALCLTGFLFLKSKGSPRFVLTALFTALAIVCPMACVEVSLLLLDPPMEVCENIANCFRNRALALEKNIKRGRGEKSVKLL